jgi:hypothetical protein
VLALHGERQPLVVFIDDIFVNLHSVRKHMPETLLINLMANDTFRALAPHPGEGVDIASTGRMRSTSSRPISTPEPERRRALTPAGMRVCALSRQNLAHQRPSWLPLGNRLKTRLLKGATEPTNRPTDLECLAFSIGQASTTRAPCCRAHG